MAMNLARLLLVLSALLLSCTAARKLQADNAMVLDAHEALRNSQTLVAAEEGMELSDVQITRSKTRLVSEVSSPTVKTESEAFVCGMLHFKVVGGLFEISASLSLKVVLNTVQNNIVGAVIKGGIGGGFTVGPPKIFGAALSALREVNMVAVPPKSLQKKGTSHFEIARWAVLRALNKEKEASPAAKLAQISDAKIKKIMEAINDVPKNMKDKGFYMTDTDPKTLKVLAITDPTNTKFIAAVQKDMEKQWLDSLVLLAKNLKDGLKAACVGNKIPTQDKYKEAFQAAYWKTYVSEKDAFNPNPKSGMFGTKSPGCAKVHEQVPSSVTNGHKPGFHNVLCVVMTHAMLIEGRTKIANKLTRGKQGYKNTIDMINILFAEVLAEPVEKIYGAAAGASKNANTGHCVDAFVDQMHLGETKAAYRASTAFRLLGDILVDGDSKTRDKRLKAFSQDNSLQEEVHRCDKQKPVDPKCGFTMYTVEDTMSLTLGWGGGINFCTPDENLLQTHIMRKRTYEANSGKPTGPPEKTLKLILAGSIFFQAEFNFELENKYWWPKVTKKGLTSALVRIQVAPANKESLSGDNCCDDPDPQTAPLFEAFFVKNAEALATAALSIFGVGAEVKGHLQAAEKTKFTRARDQFVDNIKNSPLPAKSPPAKSAAAKKRFRSLMTVGDEKNKWPIGSIITAVGVSTTYGMMRAAVNAGVMKNFLPAEVFKRYLIGGEVEFHRENGKWTHVTGGPFFLKYWGAEVNTKPWGSVGLGFDVSAGGYAGFATKLHFEWK